MIKPIERIITNILVLLKHRIRGVLWLMTMMFITFSISCGSDGSDPDDETLPVVSIADFSKVEGDDDNIFILDVRLDQAPKNEAVQVLANSRDGSALAGEDYVALVDYPIVFNPGQTLIELRVTILGNEVQQENRTFTIELSDPEGVEIGVNSATVTIIDDDLDTSLKIPETGYNSPESYSGMTLIWQDEFDGMVIDESKWSFDIGNGCDQGICNWGNAELQDYAKENAYIVEGNAIIEAQEENFVYTSARLLTKDKFEFQYGRIDIRAVLPYGKGMWPALWMLGANIDEVGWPACGEIDIMEMFVTEANNVEGNLFWLESDSSTADLQFGQPASFLGKTLNSGTFNDEFHVYSIIWNESSITWLVDNQELSPGPISIGSPGMTEFHQNFYLLMNFAVGGNNPEPPDNSSIFPQYFIIDYVRVFQDN